LYTNLFSSFEDKFSESTNTLLPLEVTSTLSFERKKLDKDLRNKSLNLYHNKSFSRLKDALDIFS